MNIISSWGSHCDAIWDHGAWIDLSGPPDLESWEGPCTYITSFVHFFSMSKCLSFFVVHIFDQKCLLVLNTYAATDRIKYLHLHCEMLISAWLKIPSSMLHPCPASILRWKMLECTFCVYYDSIWSGQGFYVDIFWLMHFPQSSHQNEEGCFPDVSSEKTYV